MSQQLHDPLTSLLTQSQQLLTTIRSARLDDQAETLAGHAAEATKLGAQLAQALHERAEGALGHTINDILDDVLMSTTLPIVDGAGIIRQFSSHLPPLVGDREQVTQLAHSSPELRTDLFADGRPCASTHREHARSGAFLHLSRHPRPFPSRPAY